MNEDWAAVKDIERVVELRRREAPRALDATGSAELEDQKIAQLMDAGIGLEAARRALALTDGDVGRAMLRATEEEHDAQPDCADGENAQLALATSSKGQVASSTTTQSMMEPAMQSARVFSAAAAERAAATATWAGAAAERSWKAWSKDAAAQPALGDVAAEDLHPHFFIPGKL
eukprot:2446721-Amphidinium_carterae.1